MKKTIYKIIILIGLTLFVYFMFTYFQNIYYFNKQKCECQKNEIYIGSKSFSFNGVLGTNLENAKALVFKKGSNFKIVIDSTNLKLLETDVYYDEKKNVRVKIEPNKSLKKNVVNFDKLITANADWIFILNNGKKLKITDIKTNLVQYTTMFDKIYFCEITSLKINGIKNDTLITGLSE